MPAVRISSVTCWNDRPCATLLAHRTQWVTESDPSTARLRSVPDIPALLIGGHELEYLAVRLFGLVVSLGCGPFR